MGRKRRKLTALRYRDLSMATLLTALMPEGRDGFATEKLVYRRGIPRARAQSGAQKRVFERRDIRDGWSEPETRSDRHKRRLRASLPTQRPTMLRFFNRFAGED